MTNTETGHCNNPSCDYPDVACQLGHMNVADCDHFQIGEEEEAESSSGANISFPWTGRVFGLKDLMFVAARRKPLTIGVVGLQNAGKTTLLAIIYLMLLRGMRLAEQEHFAGSYTLEGWETITRWLQYHPNSRIMFPPHTSSSSERTPGLLHLALADSFRSRRDILISDAPGEWFNNWMKETTSANAEGARWVSKFSDRFLLVADSDALTGDDSGSARNSFGWLARRLHGEVGNRAVALVWTKTDLARPGDLVKGINERFSALFPAAPIFEVQVPPKADGQVTGSSYVDDLQAVFAWALASLHKTGSVERPAIIDKEDPFFAFGL